MQRLENRASPDDTVRGTRTRKPKTEQILCPVCGVTIRANEIDSHFELELQRLEKTSGSSNTRIRKERPTTEPTEPAASSSSAPHEAPASPPANKDSAWTTYQKIKTNRQARLKTKSRKRKCIENICPVCNRLISEDIHVHVEKCLIRTEKRQRTSRNGSDTNGGGDEDSLDSDDDDDEDSIDIVGEEATAGDGDTFEVYEWAGQTRVRASSLLLGGGYSGITSGTTTRITHAENEEDLNVDGDDTQVFGPAQFSEKDVIPPPQSQAADAYLRSLISGESPSTSTNSRRDEGTSKDRDENDDHSDDSSGIRSPLSMQGQILESLKARLKEYEQHSSTRNKTKCQICMDDYKSPCVSICCWHVHCEECWMRSLDAKKLCPKCKMITAPTDLRRIYL